MKVTVFVLLLVAVSLGSDKLKINDPLYRLSLNLGAITDFGISLPAALAGPIPLEGARFDAAGEGNVTGRINGRITVVDYVNMRADGRLDLNVRCVLTTNDGARISQHITGVLQPSPVGFNLQENIYSFTSDARYKYLNTKQLWAVGTVNLGTAKLDVRIYDAAEAAVESK